MSDVSLTSWIPMHPRFNGSDYNPQFDDKRLTEQARRIFKLMADGKWRTLEEIAKATGDPEASVSAQLRNFRKFRFGAHKVNKRCRGKRMHGLFEYQLRIRVAVR